MKRRASKRSLSKRGPNNPNAYLTAWLVDEIRRAVAERGKERGAKAAIAREYDISQGTLTDLITGRRWKHTVKPKTKGIKRNEQDKANS